MGEFFKSCCTASTRRFSSSQSSPRLYLSWVCRKRLRWVCANLLFPACFWVVSIGVRCLIPLVAFVDSLYGLLSEEWHLWKQSAPTPAPHAMARHVIHWWPNLGILWIGSMSWGKMLNDSLRRIVAEPVGILGAPVVPDDSCDLRHVVGTFCADSKNHSDQHGNQTTYKMFDCLTIIYSDMLEWGCETFLEYVPTRSCSSCSFVEPLSKN